MSLKFFEEKLLKSLELNYDSDCGCHGYDCFKYKIPESEMKVSNFNDITGLINLSAFNDIPLEASHPYFYKGSIKFYEIYHNHFFVI